MPDHFRPAPANPMMGDPPPPSPPDHPLALVTVKRGDHPHHLHHGHPASPNHPKEGDNNNGDNQGGSPGRSSSGYSERMRSSPEHSPIREDEEFSGPCAPPAHGQQHHVHREDACEDEAPLALVVHKEDASGIRPDTLHCTIDSGHEDDFSDREMPLAGSPPVRIAAVDKGRGEAPQVVVQRKASRASQGGEFRVVNIEPNVTIARVSHQLEVGGEEEEAVSKCGLKVRDFARYSESEQPMNPPLMASSPGLRRRSTNTHEISDVTSEASSVDTWPSSAADGLSVLSLGHAAGGGRFAGMASRRRPSKAASVGGGERPTALCCRYCDKAFVNRYHLQSHEVTHTGERAFACRHCDKTFGRRSTLRAHMTTHTKTSNFMCPVCEKACNDNNSLVEHIRMHTGEKPFACTVCSKAYARKSHLNVHYRVHTGERPFVCSECGKDFTEKRFLNDHVQTSHSGVDGPLRCPNCFREFAYKTSLKQHLKKQMCVKNLNRCHQVAATAVAATAATTAAAVVNVHGGHHPKQFQCPFCEKSYSWKQTLKQHVSMYHRNKVHTDEFWKYELAKHRRVGLDYTANEDMWKRQLGKHAEELAKREDDSSKSPQEEQQCSLKIVDEKVLHEEGEDRRSNEDRWLDQIQRATSNGSAAQQVASEMKLLALQSLRLMNMGLAPPAPLPQAKPQESSKALKIEEEDSSAYHLSVKDKLSVGSDDKSHTSEQVMAQLPPPPPPPPLLPTRKPSVSRSPSLSPPATAIALPDIKEEPAAKRTQMWLAQLGQYRQKSLLQEELDRNHEELWEEQISRAKRNPVRSPLEPVEITLDENDSEANKTFAKQSENLFGLQETALASKMTRGETQGESRREAPFEQGTTAAVAREQQQVMNGEAPSKMSYDFQQNRIVVAPLMSALQVHPPPLGFKQRILPPPSATITKPPSESGEPPMVLPKPKYPPPPSLQQPSVAATVAETKKMTLPLESDLPNDLLPEEPKKDRNESIKIKEEADKSKAMEDEEEPSFLKSILLDPSSRKRPSELPPPPPQTHPRASPFLKEETGAMMMMSTGSNDILRRRLLGFKDPMPDFFSPPDPKRQKNSHLLVPSIPNRKPSISVKHPVRKVNVDEMKACDKEEARQIASKEKEDPAAINGDNNDTKTTGQKNDTKMKNKDKTGEERDVKKREEALSLYAHTSVLKHLLYRYTGNTNTP